MLLDVLAWLIFIPVAVAIAVFTLETLLGLMPLRAPVENPGSSSIPETVIMVPAHDEELGIGAMLERLIGELGPTMRVLVVADNCSDRTAEIARAAGAEVLERHDPDQRGKGHALAFGRDHLAQAPPATVIVIDADCEVSGSALAQLAAAGAAGPAQGANLLKPDRSLPTMVQVSNFAHALKNIVRQTGARRLGAPNMLTGTGMTLPWRDFAALPLASGSLAEDLELGIRLARERRAVRLLPDAVVWSPASSASATLTQRSRWEGGFLTMAKHHAAPLLGEGLRTGRWPLIWLGLHLATPPMALLVLLNFAALTLVALLGVAGATLWPLLLLVLLDVAMVIALVAGWLRIGRPYLSACSMLRLPFYALWKIPMYLKLLRRGDKQWVRTERS